MPERTDLMDAPELPQLSATMFPRALERIDWWILGIFAILPVVIFTIPALFGHPALAGDNLIQNYPLRVLAGRQIASGHLPLWNPLAFSGFPLLGSLNAGAAFPATFLFAVLPDGAAWVLNVSTAYSVAAIGALCLVRFLGVRRAAAVFSSVAYGFAGAMLGHMVHLGLLQGQALLPWAVLALLVIAERFRGPASTGRFTADLINAGWPLITLAGCVGLAGLTGEPRAITDLFVVIVVVGLWTGLRSGTGGWRSRTRLVIACGLAGGVGAALSAIQILPGSAVVAYSQRSNLTAQFIGSGSLKPAWTSLLAIPTILGGNGLLHQPRWFIEYNLAEVTGYVGLIALVGLFAAVGQLVGRTRRRALPPWVPLFVVLVLVGLVLSWGNYTAAFHGILHIPLVDRTRLQSRNLAIVDLALCILLGWFIDRLLARDFDAASLEGWRRWLTLTPLGVTLALVIAAVVVPERVLSGLSAQRNVVGMEHFLWPWLVVAGLLAGSLGGLLLGWRRLGQRRAFRLLVGVCAVDLIVFVAGCTTGLVSGGADALPTRATASALIGTQGRFALVDPSLANLDQFIALGEPNVNVFTGLQSVQGYGSLVPTFYGEATDTHVQDGLNSCALAMGRLRQLRLSAVAAGTDILAPLVRSSAAPSVTLHPPAPQPCPGAPQVATHDMRSFYFGQLLTVRSITLPLSPTLVRTTAPNVVLVDGTGRRLASVPTVTTTPTGWRYLFAGNLRAGGFRVTSGALGITQGGSATDTAGNVYSLNGDYQRAMGEKSWRLVATTATYQVFRTTRPLVPKMQLEGAARGSIVHWVHTSARGADTASISMASAGTVVRSVSFVPGWTATYAPVDGGTAIAVPVTQHDLVQAITLPAGNWTVAFRYSPSGLGLGLMLSGLAIVVLGAASGFLWFHRRRRSATSTGHPARQG